METEQLANALFIKVDPILRLLSATIQRYLELREDDNAADGREEKMISLLKSQVQLLDGLMQHLNDFVNQEQINEFTVGAVGVVAGYLLLPVLVILKSYHLKQDHLAHQSWSWTCQEKVTIMLIWILEKCGSKISTDKRRDLLIVCAAAMSSEADSASNQVDRGIDRQLSLLQCISALSQGLPVADIESALDGNLVAQLALICTTIVAPEEDPQSGGVDEDQSLIQQALKTLQVLLECVPNEDVWRRLLPGMTAALFRRCLFKKSVSQTIALATTVLSTLLTVTMNEPVSTDLTTAPVDVIEQLRQLTKDAVISQATESTTSVFHQECNKRLPTPLMALFNVLHGAASPLVRSLAIQLAKTILIDTASAWTADNVQSLETAALECCIVLGYDQVESVAAIARSTLALFKSTARGVEFAESDLVSRVADMIHELPTYAMSRKSAELETRAKLLLGYLDLVDEEGVSLLSSPEESKVILESFARTLDLEFDSVQHVVSAVESSADSLRLTFRYLSLESAVLVRQVVRSLGAALGFKHGCFLLDSCVSGLQESFDLREQGGFSPSSASHISWLHEWIGAIVVAFELLRGLKVNLMMECSNTRTHRRSLYILSRALVQLITRSQLWRLPTIATPTSQIEQFSVTNTSVAAGALRGNATCLSLLIFFSGELICTIGSDGRDLLADLIYHVLERTGTGVHEQVRSSALEMLRKLASVFSSAGTVEKMMLENFEDLFRLINSEVHRLGTISFLSQFQFTQVMGLVKTAMHLSLQRGDSDTSVSGAFSNRTPKEESRVAIAIKTVTEIVSLFDRHLVRSGRDMDDIPLLELFGVMDGCTRMILDSLDLKIDGPKTETSTSQTEPWKELLEPFRQATLVTHPGKEFTPATSVPQPIEIQRTELDYLHLELDRCGFLASHRSLTVRIAGCKLQTFVYELLAAIRQHSGDGEEEGNESEESLDTAVFRQISDSWPALQGRIDALSKEFYEVHRRRDRADFHLVSALPASVSDTTALASLFELVSSMSLAAGSFIWRRLEEAVWPAVLRILNACLQEQSGGSLEPSSDTVSEKDKLLISIFHLVQKVYNIGELRETGAHRVDSLGQVILPFVGKAGLCGDEAFSAVKVMMSANGDLLWRALLVSSGRGLPAKLVWHRDHSSAPCSLQVEPTTLFEVRTNELVDLHLRSHVERPIF